MSASLLVAKLDGLQGQRPRWRAICPTHPTRHRTRSLSVLELDDGRVLIHCHAGCNVQSIVSAVGLELSDLFPAAIDEASTPTVRKPWRARDVAAALELETMVAWLLLTDIANGKVITPSDRQRAGVAAQRAVHLLQELANAS